MHISYVLYNNSKRALLKHIENIYDIILKVLQEIIVFQVHRKQVNKINNFDWLQYQIGKFIFLIQFQFLELLVYQKRAPPYFENRKSMSHIPQVMKTIVKRILSKNSTQRDSEDEKSNDHLNANENQLSKISQQQPEDLTNQKHSSLEFIKQADENSAEDDDMAKTKEFFVAMQKRRLNYLYPNFKQAEVEAAACKIWQDLQPEERQVYTLKSKQSNGEQYEQLQLWAKMNEETMKSKRSLKLGIEEGQIQSDEETQIKHQKLKTEVQQRSEVANSHEPGAHQSSSSLEQGEVAMSRQASNNDETNTSSVGADQAHVQIIVLPTVEVLVETEKSVVDSDAHQSKDEANLNNEGSDKQNQEDCPASQDKDRAQLIQIQVEVVSTVMAEKESQLLISESKENDSIQDKIMECSEQSDSKGSQ